MGKVLSNKENAECRMQRKKLMWKFEIAMHNVDPYSK